MKFPFFNGQWAKRKSSLSKSSRRNSFLRRGMMAEQLEERALFAVVDFRLEATPVFNVSDPSTVHPDGLTVAHPGLTNFANVLSPVPTLKAATGSTGTVTVDKGTQFELRVYVRDTASNALGDTQGIFQAPLNLELDSSKVTPSLNESQVVTFATSTLFTGGSLTVGMAGKTTQTVNFNSNAAFFTLSLEAAVQNLVGGTGNASLVNIGNAANPYKYQVNFFGDVKDTNLPVLTFNLSGLTGGNSQSVTVVENDGGFQGANTSNQAIRDAFIASPAIAPNTGGQRFYGPPIVTRSIYADDPNGVDKIQGFIATSPATQTNPAAQPGTTEREYGYFVFNTVDGTDGVATTFRLNFSDLPFDTTPDDRNTISRFLLPGETEGAVDPSTVGFTAGVFNLIIVEYVSAKADIINSARATVISGNTFRLNLLADNGNGADTSEVTPAPATPLIITDVSATTRPGSTVTVAAGGQSVNYTPPAGFVIASPTDTVGVVTDTFTYDINTTSATFNTNLAYRDTATVTVRLIAPNQAPVNNGLPVTSVGTPLTVVEGSPVVLAGAISITDIDNTTSVPVTVTFAATNSGGTTIPGTFSFNSGATTGAGPFSRTDTVANLNALLAGGLTFTPTNSDFNGTFTLTMTTNDNGSGNGAAQSDIDTVFVSITAVNDAPTVTVIGNQSITEEDVLSFNGVSVADVDANEGTGSHLLEVTIEASRNSDSTLAGTFSFSPSNPGVTVSTNAAGNLVFQGTLANINAALTALRYTPDPDVLGDFTFDIDADDSGNTGTGGAQVGSNFFEVNIRQSTRPIAQPDIYDGTVVGYGAATEETVFTLPTSPLINDRIHDGASPRLVPIANAPPGTFIKNLVLTPDVKLVGQTFTPPSSFITPITFIADPNNGFTNFSIDLAATGMENFYGTIEFDYEMTDTIGNDPTSTITDVTGHVRIVVNNVNDIPVRTDSTPIITTGTEDTDLELGLTSFFSDADGDTLTIELVSQTQNGQPVNGTLVSGTIGAVTYQPQDNLNGEVVLTFRARDTANTVSADLVTVNVNFAPVNDPPTTMAKSIPIDEDSLDNLISLTDVVTDIDNDPATITVTNVVSNQQGTFGTFTNVADGFMFSPRANFNGPLVLTYTIDDGTGPKTGTINVTVTAMNDAPITRDDPGVGNPIIQVGEGSFVDINVLANDSDVDASPTFSLNDRFVQAGTTIQIVSGPVDGNNVTVGSLTQLANGQIRYTAPATVLATTTVTFVYTITDPTVGGVPGLVSNESTVTITLQPKNDPPTANAFTLAAMEDTNLAFNIFDQNNGNVSDPDSPRSQWTVEIVSPTQTGQNPNVRRTLHGTLTIGADGAIVYRADNNYNGPDSFSYVVNDNSTIAPNNLKSAPRTVTINVAEVNDAPIANNDSQANGRVPLIIANPGNNPLVNEIDVLANDTFGPDAANIDGPLVIVSVGSSTTDLTSGLSAKGGTVTIVNGKVRYKSAPGIKDETDSFTYTIRDRNGTGLSATATVTFQVQEALPVDVNISVYEDIRFAPRATYGNGIRDAGEVGFHNVTVVLVGHDFNGTFVRQIRRTDFDGNASIKGVLPGTYRVRQFQPAFVIDGRESSPDIRPGSNYVGYRRARDWFELNIPTAPNPQNDTTIDLFFGETGRVPQTIPLQTNSIPSNTGLLVAVNKAGQSLWNRNLGGWDNIARSAAYFQPNLAKMRLVTVGTGSIGRGVAIFDQLGSPGYTILRVDPVTGDKLIQLHGTASQYGLPLLEEQPSFASLADTFFSTL